MVGWHHQLDGHVFEQAPEIGDRQGSLVCCSPRGRKEQDTAELLNCTDSFAVVCKVEAYHSSHCMQTPSSFLDCI